MAQAWIWLPVLLCATTTGFAQTPDAEFFESRIRPVLATRCFACHSSKLAAPKGDFVVDTKAGLAKGGRLGPEIVPGKPAESRLLAALRYSDQSLAMPPSGKLSDQVIADFESWIAKGAFDPRVDRAPEAGAVATATGTAPLKGMPIEQGRSWWAFQPVASHTARKSKSATGAPWPKNNIDGLILAKLEEKNLAPSPRADRHTLVSRAYVDLVGYKPTYEEVQAFVNDASPNAYERLIDDRREHGRFEVVELEGELIDDHGPRAQQDNRDKGWVCEPLA